jgi:glycerol-3-phosphate O-acyltransferase
VACEWSAAEIVAHALCLGVIERLAHPLGDLIRVPAGQEALLANFRNNVLHLFALPSVVACLLSQNPTLARPRFEAAVLGIVGLLRPELFLRWSVRELPSALALVLAALADRGLVRLDAEQLAAPETNSETYAELRLIGETIRPTLERYFLTLALLQHQGSGRLTRCQLEESGHLLAQRLALLYEFNAPEFAEKSLFSGVVGNLLAAGLLSEDASGVLCFDERISAPAEHTELLLAAEVRQTIRRMAAGGGVSAPLPMSPCSSANNGGS